MRNGRVLPPIVIVALATGAWMLSPGQAQQGSAALNVVAVVNIAQVFKESKEIAALKAEFDTETALLQKEDKTRRAVLERKQAEVNSMLPDSKDFDKRSEELLQETINYQVWQKLTSVHLINKHRVKTEFFYQKIMSKVAEAARENGFQLVIYKEDYQLKDAGSPEELLEMIRQRKVLYTAPRCDLTAEVVKKLNAG